MARSIRCIQDVVDWGLCMGCGACYALCSRKAVALHNFEHIGIRPRIKEGACAGCTECLEICPGYAVDVLKYSYKKTGVVQRNQLIGPTLEVWEGYAADEGIRFRASSGGAITALALYCLEVEHFAFVLHTGMNPQTPWKNITVQSRSKQELMEHTGSRYNASSPCDSLALIDASDRPCVFIGKPCDAAAVAALRARRPALDKNLGLVLTFFCAGTPSVQATLDLLKRHTVNTAEVNGLRYRGNGWPGGFSIQQHDTSCLQLQSYNDSWHFLQKYRCMRCHLCPDGLGEMADISCGDAWHRYTKSSDDPGQSLVLARSDRGRDIIKKALERGYLQLVPSNTENIIAAQGLVERRKEIFGRQLAMKLLMIPTTQYAGFHLFRNWLQLTLIAKSKTILGTLRRILHKNWWRKLSCSSPPAAKNIKQEAMLE